MANWRQVLKGSEIFKAFRIYLQDNGQGQKLYVEYEEELDTSVVPDPTDFTLNLGKTVTNVAIQGRLVILDLSSPFTSEEQGVISYTPGVNPITRLRKVDSESLSNQSLEIVLEILRCYINK